MRKIAFYPRKISWLFAQSFSRASINSKFFFDTSKSWIFCKLKKGKKHEKLFLCELKMDQNHELTSFQFKKGSKQIWHAFFNLSKNSLSVVKCFWNNLLDWISNMHDPNLGLLWSSIQMNMTPARFLLSLLKHDCDSKFFLNLFHNLWVRNF